MEQYITQVVCVIYFNIKLMTLRKMHHWGNKHPFEDNRMFQNQDFGRDRNCQNRMEGINSGSGVDNYQKFPLFYQPDQQASCKPTHREVGVLDQIFINDQERNQNQQNGVKFSFDTNYQSPFCLQNKVDSKPKRSQTHKKDVLSVLVTENDSCEKKFREVGSIKKGSDSRVGSIKKNKKTTLADSEECENEFLNEMNLNDIEYIRMSKLNEMNEKLNRVLNKENRVEGQNGNMASYRLKNMLTKDYESLKDSQESEIANLFPQSIQTVKQQRKETKEENGERPNPTPYIETLFDLLDKKKIGQLSRSNCFAEGISEEFKFIFGGIFTKIFLKDLVCTKALFVKLCHNTLRQLDSDEVFSLLKKLSPGLVSSHILMEEDSDGRSSPNFHQKESKRESEDHLTSSEIKAMKYRQQSKAISESNLKEQRRTIIQLNELSKKLTEVISTQQLCEQNDEFQEEQSLRFDELVKFI